MWRRARINMSRWNIRRFSSAICRGRYRLEDEGDWYYSREWWGTESDGHTVFRSDSSKGNGVVTVVAYPCSRPDVAEWPTMERWLQQRYAKIYPDSKHNEQFRILGYQWRVLRFNDTTRQSAVKIMATYKKSDPGSVYLMQQPHCLAVPYLKSMFSSGLTTLASCNYDVKGAACGEKTMHILCIGHGGGSLPLFLASNIQGAIVHVVEIDPVVISASIQEMGFPSSAVKRTSINYPVSQLDAIDKLMWKGIHNRLFLYESDAESFVLDDANLYDLVFIDAYDGEDIFPWKLWDPNSSFLKALQSQLHPKHGTVVVNLHADSDILNSDETISSHLDQILPMGRYVSQVCRAYKDMLLQGSGNASDGKSNDSQGLAFTVTVPWLCNVSLVVCRGFGSGRMQGSDRRVCIDKDTILNNLTRNARLVEDVLDLPFSCLQYMKSGFVMVD
ncbi:hypothetical protein AAC387_Pa08g1227 [Persea americana]